MVEERGLRDELERLQVHARGLRDELSRDASPAFLERRASLTQELERRQAVVVEWEATAARAEAELRPVAEQVARTQAELERAEQQALPAWLATVPLAFLAVATPLLLEAPARGALALGAVSAALFGAVLGFSFARPAAAPAPLMPTLAADVFFNPAAWALVVLVPVVASVGIAFELVPSVRWAADFPLATLLPASLSLGVASFATALAARQALTTLGRVALVPAVALTFLLAALGHRGIADLGLDATGLTWLGARTALLVPIATAVVLVASALFSLRRATFAVALAAAVASMAASVSLAGAGRLTPDTPREGGLIAFLVAERSDYLAAVEALAGTEQQLARNRQGDAPRNDEERVRVRAMLEAFQVEHFEALAKARARVADDVTLVVLSLALALLALLAAWAPPRGAWLIRAAAVLPLVLLVAAMNLRNV